MCYHDNMITHKTDFVNPHSYIGEISSFVTKSFWASINYLMSHKLLEVLSSLFKVLVKAVACGGRR